MPSESRKNLYNQRKKDSSKKVKSWNPGIMSPIAGQLTSTITRVTQEFLVEVNNTDVKIPEYVKMARKDPVVRSAIELKCLRASLMLGRYRHSNSTIEKWVQSNLDNIQGGLSHKVGVLGSAMPLGFSTAEIVFEKTPTEWRLKNINPLEQTRTTFEGKGGVVANVLYQESDGDKLAIPYKKCLHIVNGYASNIGQFDPVYGDAESGTAYQYYKAKQAILTEMMIAAKQNASGLWVGKADSNETVQVVDSKGNPVFNNDGSPKTEPAMLSLLKQLLNLENSSVVVTDLKNSITPLTVDTKEGFWEIALRILDDGIRKAYSVPKLVFEEGSGSFGVNGIGKQHTLIMDAQIESVAVQIRDQLLEKVIKPLLVWNFGITEDFGTFSLDPVEDPEAKNLQINNIISATGAQILLPTDLTVQNRMRELLGLPSITKEEQFVISQENLLNKYFEQMLYVSNSPPPLFAQQALQSKETVESEKQMKGLPSELNNQNQISPGQAETNQTTEDGKPAKDGDNGNAGTTPKDIEDGRKRMNVQNASKKKD